MIEQKRNQKMERINNRLKTIHAYRERVQTPSLCDSYEQNIFKTQAVERKFIEKFNPHNGNYSQEYQRLQENQRIIKRIINPKRCKIIQRSIENVHSLERSGNNGQQRAKSEHHQRKKTNKIVNFKDQFTNLNQKCPFMNFTREDYDLKLQNERMGKRILYAKPIVRSFHAESPNKRPHSKINRGVIAFFNRKLNSRERQRVSKDQNMQSSRLKSHYGYGPTILCLRNIKINLNPPLKDDDLLFLQLLVKNTNSRLYKTQIISYKQLTNCQFKFALRIKRIGEFVPLRIWKINNMNSLQVGIVDIQFSKYLNLQQQSSGLLAVNKQNQHGVILTNKEGKIKAIVKDRLECRLRKTKVQEAHGEISLQYLIYRKKYT